MTLTHLSRREKKRATRVVLAVLDTLLSMCEVLMLKVYHHLAGIRGWDECHLAGIVLIMMIRTDWT